MRTLLSAFLFFSSSVAIAVGEVSYADAAMNQQVRVTKAWQAATAHR